MSGRSVPVARHRRINPVAPAIGLFVVGCAVLCGPAARCAAEPPPIHSPIDSIDDRPPLPPEGPSGRAKYLIPEQDRAIFAGFKDPKTGVVTGGIEDEKPLASEKQNPDEYAAWAEVVRHARQFAAAELAEHGIRNLTPDDLTYPVRKFFRLELVRFDGKLLKARRLKPTKAIEGAGLKEMYESWLLPPDEPPSHAVCVVCTDWPAGLSEPPEIPAGQLAGEWVTIDRWGSFGGYYFKLTLYPGPGANPKDPTGPSWRKSPLLVGRSVVVLANPPAEATSAAIDKKPRIYKLIRDDAPLGRTPTTWEELAAWNRVALHARAFTPEALEAAARTDLKFADLFDEHRKDYQLDLVSFRGRLIRVRADKAPERLAEAGVPTSYEGWLVPDGEPRGNPVCIVLTELPPGVEPKQLMNLPVSFAGYSFKLLRYESGEVSKEDPTKNVWKRAPLLIGRSVILRGTDDADGPSTWASWFVPGIVGGLLVLIGTALGMTWWFRRGDRRARDEIDANLGKNPFTE